MNVLLVSLGGALGAVIRYALMSAVGHVGGSHFPYSTLAVNILGSFLLGVTVSVIAKQLPEYSQSIHLFLVVGFFGAFTTFSTFSLDTVFLLENGAIWPAMSYIMLSISLGVVGLFGGLYIGGLF